MKQVIRPILQDWQPLLTPVPHRSLTHWVVGAVLAGNANGPALMHVLTTARGAGVATLTDQWTAWLQQDALQTTDPPRGEDAPVVSPLAIGAQVLRIILTWWTDDRLILGMDASLRRADVVLLRLSVRYRGTTLPVGWAIILAPTPGAWASSWDRLLDWAATVLDASRWVVVVKDRGLWSPQLWQRIRSHGWHPVMRVQATVRPIGQARQMVREVVPGPGYGWIGSGAAFKDASRRLDGTIAVVWDNRG